MKYLTGQATVFTTIIVIASAGRAFSQQDPGALLWSFNAGLPINSAPAVSPDSTVYISVHASLLAVTNGGSNVWSFPVDIGNHQGFGSPAIAADGTVYLESGQFYAITPNGSLRWNCPAYFENGSPAVGPDNTIYAHGYYLYALSQGGTILWSNATGGSYLFGSPSLTSAGTVIDPSPELGNLYAVSASGAQQWTFPAPLLGDSVAIAGDGTVYVAAQELAALNQTGSNLWTFAPVSFARSLPSVGRDGAIYVACRGGGTLFAVNPSGTLRWQTNLTFNDITNVPAASAPAIDSAGMIYYPTRNTLYAVYPDGNVAWTFVAPPGAFNRGSPTIGPDGTIYLPFGSVLYALYNTNKVADAPWPMYRQNARHTGKVEKPSLQKPQKRADGGFQFQVYSQLGGTNTVQASPDLTSWTSLTDIVITNVPMDVIDYTASNFASRFYRTVTQ